jgi:hypothetical protein
MTNKYKWHVNVTTCFHKTYQNGSLRIKNRKEESYKRWNIHHIQTNLKSVLSADTMTVRKKFNSDPINIV